MEEQHQNDVASDDPAGGATTLSAPVKKPAPPPRKPRQLPPYKLLLHNDDVNTFDHVVRSIVRITSATPEDAINKALEAHEHAVSLLLVTHLEKAELYRDQFTSLKLTTTIEPAD